MSDEFGPARKRLERWPAGGTRGFVFRACRALAEHCGRGLPGADPNVDYLATTRNSGRGMVAPANSLTRATIPATSSAGRGRLNR